MADISLHYSFKAPLAGTYTAFRQTSCRLWRQRITTGRSSPSSTPAPCVTSA